MRTSRPTSALDRQSVRVFTHGPCAGHAFFVVSTPADADSAAAAESAYRQLAHWLQQHRLQILHERVFGSHDVDEQVMATRARAFDETDGSLAGPVTYVGGNSAWRGCFAGLIVHAVGGHIDNDLSSVHDALGMPCGRCWRQGELEWIMLQNLPTPAECGCLADDAAHARRAIEQANSLLHRRGASYQEVVRTWFYLDHILAWYDRFNDVRSTKYAEFQLSPPASHAALRLPASTGIGGSVGGGRPVTLNLLAVASGTPTTAVRQLHNPAQMDAFRYGSAFSRGALVRTGELTLVEMSGTAAIDERGRSLYAGDFDRQLSATLDRAEELLKSCGGRLEQVSAATAFVKRPDDVPRFWDTLACRGLDELPVVCMVTDICREELLFELDAELMLTP